MAASPLKHLLGKAKIRERDAGDTAFSYIVEDAAGRQEFALRSSLHHRVFVKQSHVGVTGDKTHDR